MAQYSTEMAAAVSRYFDMNRYRSRFDQDEGTFTLTIPLESRIRQAQMEISVGNTTLIATARISLVCEKTALRETMEFILRLNAALNFGAFMLDPDTGEVWFRFGLDCAGVMPSYDMIDHLVSLPVIVLGTYLDALVSVMLGFSDAKKALQKAALKSIGDS